LESGAYGPKFQTYCKIGTTVMLHWGGLEGIILAQKALRYTVA